MSRFYSIRAVAEETGLSPHTIRAWERRYNVLSPERTGTNRRVYDEGDVELLKLLHSAVKAGHSIGMIASLSTEELQRVAQSDVASPTSQDDPTRFLRDCCQSLLDLNAERLNSELGRASSVLGVDTFIRDLILPMMAFIDGEWSEGRLSIAQEHLASALVRTHLDRLRHSIQPPSNAPRAVVATPANQQHEIGALLAAIVAARADWNVTYLGPNLPASEIAQAAVRTKSKVVALSLVYPFSEAAVEEELVTLGALLGQGVHLLIGGRAARSYSEAIREIRAEICEDLDSLRESLLRLRQSSALRRQE